MNTDQAFFAYLVSTMDTSDQNAIAPLGWPACRTALHAVQHRFGSGASLHAPDPRRILAMSREVAFRLLRA